MGALKMALEGKSANEILLHYFSSTEVKKIYD
jgi:peptidoglycan hydrolase-like amidase